MELNNQEKLLLLGLADELLLNHLDSEDHFEDEEREDIADRIHVIFDVNAPKTLREAFIELSRKFYEDVKEGDGEC